MKRLVALLLAVVTLTGCSAGSLTSDNTDPKHTLPRETAEAQHAAYLPEKKDTPREAQRDFAYEFIAVFANVCYVVAAFKLT